MIKVSNLDKYYNKGKANEIHVIDNTSLEFGSTGLVCILGESGSGKTTLLNTIGGLDTFQNGNITIDEATINKYSERDIEKLRNNKFGYIFQDQSLLQEETVAYNIRLAINMYDISEVEKEARVDYVLQAVGMKKYKKRLVAYLSGGQQQRVAIARALVKSPEIIFADEPTGNLDEANTMRIMSIIKKISSECLVILVTHEKKIAEFFADRIIYINEGKVEKDSQHEGKKTYRYNDDTNLYLKEFGKETFNNNNISINLYSNGDNKEIKLNMVYSEGKLYIQQPSEAEVVFLTSGDETKMVDDVRPELNLNQIEDFEYTLDPVQKRSRPKLSLKELWRLANGNVSMLGKRQIFLIVSLILTSILLVFAVADYITTASVDKKSIVTEDSHYIEVMGKRNTSAGNEEYFKSYNLIYDSFVQSKVAEDIYISLESALSFSYSGYGQTKRLSYTLSDFSYVTLDHISEKDLVCGRMPQKKNEIVIDQWLIDVFENSDNVLKTLMPNNNSFLNLEVNSDISGQKLIIVGVSDMGEPTIYIDKYAGISTSTWADKLASLQQLQAQYPGQYDEINLKSDEVLVSEEALEQMKKRGELRYHTKSGTELTVKGTFPDEFGVSFVVDDKNYQSILRMYICSSRRFVIYTDEKEKFTQYFEQNQGGFDTTDVKMMVSNTYDKQIAKFKAERAVSVNSQSIVTITIFLLSMIMLYFALKSNVMKITKELSVYRLVGIPKRSIIEAFILEITIITSYTVLPAILITSSIIKFIAGMPSLQTGIVYPWYAVAILLVFLYAVNILVGIIPVYNVIKQPPAQIAGRG